MNQETKQWLDMADMDLGVAKYLMENYYLKPLEIFVIIVNKLRKKTLKHWWYLEEHREDCQSFMTYRFC